MIPLHRCPTRDSQDTSPTPSTTATMDSFTPRLVTYLRHVSANAVPPTEHNEPNAFGEVTFGHDRDTGESSSEYGSSFLPCSMRCLPHKRRRNAQGHLERPIPPRQSTHRRQTSADLRAVFEEEWGNPPYNGIPLHSSPITTDRPGSPPANGSWNTREDANQEALPIDRFDGPTDSEFSLLGDYPTSVKERVVLWRSELPGTFADAES